MPGPSYHAWTHSPNGTDPIGLADGDEFNIKVFGDTTTVTTGDGKFIFAVPADLNGHNLIDVGAYVTTTSSSGLPTVQIRNVTQAADMLTTKVTIKVGELDSYGPGSTATPPVIDTANDDVATGDQLAIDVDVAGTGAKGLGVILVFNSDPPGQGAKGEPGDTGATGPPGADGADGAISVIEDEGTPLTVRSNVNFVGSGVTAADAGGKTVVTISGGGSDDGWVSAAETWTYSSADGPTGVFTVAADVTTKYSPGMRVKYTQTTVKYGIITAVSTFSGGNTTITIYGGTDYTTANAAITAPFYSTAKVAAGFNASPAKWTVEVTDTSDRTQSSPANNTWYNLGSVTISIPIGVWDVSYLTNMSIANSSADTQVEAYTTLSTANNSEVDKLMTALMSTADASAAGKQIITTVKRNRILTLAAKTSYYLNYMSDSGGSSLAAFNSYSTTVIRAVCAYL